MSNTWRGFSAMLHGLVKAGVSASRAESVGHLAGHDFWDKLREMGLQRGICFLLIAASCLVQKFFLPLASFCCRSLILRTWCISTFGSPQTRQLKCNEDFVSLAFHLFGFDKTCCTGWSMRELWLPAWSPWATLEHFLHCVAPTH